MTKHTTFAPSLAFFFVMTVLSVVSAQAQSQAPDARWFRVELLVFSHESGSADSAENWDPTPQLSYPDAVRFLIDPAQVERNIEDYGPDSALDPRGVQTILLPVPAPEPGSKLESDAEPISTDIPHRDKDPELASPAGVAEVDANAMGADNLDPAAVAPEDTAPLRPDAFTLRAGTEMEFRGKAAYMQRTGNYRTLLHQTWLQPMSDESNALPIVLDRSGDSRDWPLLQGSIKLYLSRYLHIEADLWLNTSGNYLPGRWTMPAPPLGPPSLILIEPEASLPANVDTDALANAALPALPQTADETDPLALEEPLVAEPVYAWRHAIAFKERRRMRSNEVHYLDHPMLGVVVKLTPLSEEELEAIAEADLAAAELANADATEDARD